MTPKKRIGIVIIHGSRMKGAHAPFLRRFFYRHLGVSSENKSKWLSALRDRLRPLVSAKSDVIIFRWSGGITPITIHAAAKRLAQQLRRDGFDEIRLICKSLGGHIGALVAAEADLPVTKLVCIAYPHPFFSKPLPRRIHVVNVYSPDDIFHTLADDSLYAGFGRKYLHGARNIRIPRVSHSDFNTDKFVAYGSRRVHLFTLYAELLARNSK